MFKGFKHTEEAKRKISEGRRVRKEKLGYLNSPETRAKIGKAQKGRKHSEKTKQKMSIAKKGKKPKNFDYFLKKAHEANKGRTGDKAAHWKGDKVGYSGLHDWIRKQLGTPNKCEKCGTTKARRYEWANISGEYKRDLSDWRRLCVSCHRKEGYKKGEYKLRQKANEIKET